MKIGSVGCCMSRPMRHTLTAGFLLEEVDDGVEPSKGS